MALTDNVLVAYHLDVANVVADAGPNGLTLTNNNSVGTAAGRLAEAGDFERGSSQWLSRADNALFDVTDLSVSFWINVESFNDYGCVVGRWLEGTSDRVFAVVVFADQKVYAYNSSDGAGAVALASSALSGTGTWINVVVTWDSADAVTGKKIYINGSLDVSGAMAGLFGSSAAALGIGNVQVFAGGSAYFDGLIDEVVVWGRVLSAPEAAELYNGGAGLAYPFDAGSILPLVACDMTNMADMGGMRG